MRLFERQVKLTHVPLPAMPTVGDLPDPPAVYPDSAWDEPDATLHVRVGPGQVDWWVSTVDRDRFA